MKIAIVGSGLTGLYLGNLLKKYNNPDLQFTIFERAYEPRNIGGGLDIWGNGVAFLRHIGLDDFCDRYGDVIKFKVEKTRDEDYTLAQDFVAFNQAVQDTFMPIERYRLIDQLLQPISSQVSFNSEVVDIENGSDSVELSFADGNLESFDLVLAADGANSFTRTKLFGEIDKEYCGLLWAGAHIPKQMIPTVQGNLLKVNAAGEVWGLRPTPDGMVWMYIFKEREDKYESIASKLPHFIRGQAKLWGETVQEIVEYTADEHMFIVKTFNFQPLPKWGENRVFLVGDAGHLMSPLLGQNTCIAFEDAYVLVDLIKNLQSQELTKEKLKQIHQSYIAKRHQRVLTVHQEDQKKIESFLRTKDSEIAEKLKNSQGTSVVKSLGYMKKIIEDRPLLDVWP